MLVMSPTWRCKLQVCALLAAPVKLVTCFALVRLGVSDFLVPTGVRLRLHPKTCVDHWGLF